MTFFFPVPFPPSPFGFRRFTLGGGFYALSQSKLQKNGVSLQSNAGSYRHAICCRKCLVLQENALSCRKNAGSKDFWRLAREMLACLFCTFSLPLLNDKLGSPPPQKTLIFRELPKKEQFSWSGGVFGPFLYVFPEEKKTDRRAPN